MGLSVLDIERLAQARPLEAEDGLPPLVSVRDGETLWEVGRWDENYTPGFLLRWLIWAVWRFSRGKVIPQPWEHIGPFDSKEKAEAACVDKTYYLFPAALNRALPRERVRVAGLSFPRRALHRLYRPAASDEVDPYRLVRASINSSFSALFCVFVICVASNYVGSERGEVFRE